VASSKSKTKQPALYAWRYKRDGFNTPYFVNFSELEPVKFHGQFTSGTEVITSECAKVLRRVTGLSIKPGECRKVTISIKPVVK
jgi:hypothetical protein